MNSKRLLCAESRKVLAPVILIPESFAERARGLLKVRSDEHPGMLLRKCRCIHMFGMRVSLDIIFLDDMSEVTRVVQHLEPWRLAWCWRGLHALELPAGSASRLGIIQGRRLEVC